MKKIDRDIYDLGELARHAAFLAQFATHGGWFYRFFKWLERSAEGKRKTLIEKRDYQRQQDRILEDDPT